MNSRKALVLAVGTTMMVSAAYISQACQSCAAQAAARKASQIAARAAKAYEPCQSGVEKPSIKPSWSGAKVGTWTMDYEAAFENAAKNGKYMLLYFSGMWWCPRCKELEKYVLKESAWTKFVKNRGLYLAVIDHPARNGKDRWCWLWDASYRKTAKLSPLDAANVIADRYALQEAMYDPASTYFRTASNYVVEVVGKGNSVMTNYTVLADRPVSQYHSINYPGIIVIAPDGSEAGRFIPDTSENSDYTLPTALQYCMDQVDAAINPKAIDMWVGSWTLAYTHKAMSGVGTMSLSISDKGTVKVSGFQPNGVKFSNTVPFVTGVKGCWIPVRFNKKDADPAFSIRIDNETGAIRLEDEESAFVSLGFSKVGYALPDYAKLTIGGFPEMIGGCPVIPESVPTNLVLMRKGAVLKSDNGVSFSYTQKTGVFKGSFKVEVLKNGRAVKVGVTVNGVCIDGRGIGTAVAKGSTDAATVELVSTDAPVVEDGDCGECGL